MKLKVNIRQGEKSSQLRKDGSIPAIVYGKHLQSPISISCNKNDFIKKYKAAGYSTPITLDGKDVEEMVLIQDIQLDPVSNIVLHVDFLAVSKDEKVSTEVPVILVGESPIEKLGEGKIQLVKDFVEVEAFPQDLPHDIKIDISNITNVHDTVFIKDLEVSDKVRIKNDAEQPVVTVVSLTEEVEEAATEATAEAAAPQPEKK
ncbi:TPA: 50S ribosomal protein L25 [Patescibacteria group bacterium]|nr:50S ribosomal protein L25 [Candidatus Gracilibacteria bacterium]